MHKITKILMNFFFWLIRQRDGTFKATTEFLDGYVCVGGEGWKQSMKS